MNAPVPAVTDEQPLDPQDPSAVEATDAESETVPPEGAAEDGSPEVVAVTETAAEPAAEQTAEPVAPTPMIPDRADAPVSEVAERFLRAVIAEVPLELIEELHLFSPLRQGTVETGIAVLAARVPVAEPAAASGEPELPFEAETVVAAAVVAEAEAGFTEADVTGAGETETAVEDVVEGDDAPLGDDTIVVSEDGRIVLSASLMGDDDEMLDEEMLAEMLDEEMLDDEEDADAAEGDADELDVIAAEGDDDEDVSADVDAVVEASADESDEAEAVAEVVAPSAPSPRPVRHTVYTARYRYVIKGPERGKWESNIKAEADAPLITVETVVRGVQRRAGEESEIVRYTGAQIARALRVPYPA